jgi:hypothetical protein
VKKITLRQGAPVREYSAPAAKFRDYQSKFSVRPWKNGLGGAIVVSGQDFIGTVNVPDGTLPGVTLLNIQLNPLASTFNNTRLQKFAEIYEKFCFKKLRFRVSTGNPTTYSGSYMLAYDRDAGDRTPPAGDTAIRSFMAMASTRMGPLWEPLDIDCPLADTQDFYYTSQETSVGATGGTPYVGDIRLSTQGQVYVSSGFGTTNSSGATAELGLWLEYECLLMDPQMEARDQVMTVIEDPTFVTNATSNNGFTGMAPAVDNRGKPLFFQTDAAGKVFLTLPEGIFQFEQFLSVATALTALEPSTLVPFINALTAVVTAIQGQSAIIGGSGWRVELLEVPQGGARLYIGFTVATTIANYFARVESAVLPFI